MVFAGDSPLEQISVRKWNKLNSTREATNNVCLKILHTANMIFIGLIILYVIFHN